MEFVIDFKDHFKSTGQTKEFEEQINQALSVFLDDPYFALFCSNNKFIKLIDVICPDCKKEITLNCNYGRLTSTESCAIVEKPSDDSYYMNVPSGEILILNKSQIDTIIPIDPSFAAGYATLKGYYEQFGVIYVRNLNVVKPLGFHTNYENYCLNIGEHKLLIKNNGSIGASCFELNLSDCYLIDKSSFNLRKHQYGVKDKGFMDSIKIGKGFFEVKYNYDTTTVKKIGDPQIDSMFLYEDISYSPLQMINYNGNDIIGHNEKIVMYKIIDQLFNKPSFLHENGWISNKIVNPRFFKKPLRFNHLFDFVGKGEPFQWSGNFYRIKEHVKSGTNISKPFVDLIFKIIYSVLKYGILDNKGNIDTGIKWIETRNNCYEIFEELVYQGFDVPSYWNEDNL